MKLLSCHIENFGKLSDLDLDFRDGLHPILEENEWGKSTLAAFLLAMFYGFTGDRKRTLQENVRRRYLPWQGGAFGGSVTFAWEGRHLRLERSFGSKNAAEDRLDWYDAETNLPLPGMPEVPGEAVFAIDRDSFCRTIFIAQQDCGTRATAGIQAKIGHLEGESADMASYREVQEALKKELDALSPSRKPGRIRLLTDEVARLEAESARRPQCEETLRQLEERRRTYAEQLQELQQDIEEKTEQVRQLSVFREAVSNYALTEAEEVRLQQLDALFSKGMPEEGEMAEAMGCLREIRHLRAELDALSFAEEESAEEEKPVNNSNPWIGALLLGIFAAAVMAFFFNRFLALALLVSGILIILLKDRYDKVHEIPDRPVEIKTRKTRQRLIRAAETEKMRAAKGGELREAEGELRAFLQMYYTGPEEITDLSWQLQQLDYDRKEYQALLEKEERSRAASNRFHENAQEAGQDLWHSVDTEEQDASPEELAAVIAEKKETCHQIEQAIRELTRQAEDTRQELDVLQEAEETGRLRKEELEEDRHRYTVLSRTADSLAQARANFTAQYMKPIKTAFDHYYTLLTGISENRYEMDADLNVMARAQGSLHETEALSEGARDLVGLCRRMAMIDAMYEKESPFLIFDDPFVNLDKGKLDRALRFLEELSERYQILYFTCHESRVP